MAGYSTQQGRDYGRNYGHALPFQRDVAYANIFGAAPPPGRSQTMTSQTPQMPSERSQTMSSQTADVMQRVPPVQQPSNGYASPVMNSYQQPSPPPAQRQPQPQYLPQPLQPDRRPYGLPQRLDARTASQPIQPQYIRPVPNRYPGRPTPGPNTDTYRSQSLATVPRPQFQPPGSGSSYNIAPAHTFRQQPYVNHMARTTAQGRVVPERPDERTMSMTSYARDSEYAQTMSGRVIPNRRRESGSQDGITLEKPSSGPSFATSSPSSPNSKTRSTSQGRMSSRNMSMTSTVVASSERTDTMSSRPSVTKSDSQKQQATMVSQRRQPLVYPALLSRVAEVFRERIPLSEKEKDGLVYKNAFTGAEAVDLIAFIIKTTDRNLALLLGRSLDAQKFFHDVTYAHRLRDSQTEVYQFKETIDDSSEVNGVFTLLTECYSPTCTRDRLCYSIACPRRLEQQARLNMRPQPGLKREDSKSSLHEDQADEQKLWINTVSKEVADSVGDREKKRQEVISELMYTERDFVKDLEYLRDFWMKPLRSPNTSPIPEHRREKFVRTVFSNCQEVYMVSSRLAEALTRRQQQGPVVRNVGDIFLEFVPHFGPFIKYGANQLYGKHEYENEKRSNPAFSRFADQVERMKESRKLELNGYLTKPTTRLARYPLLLENIVKYTADDNPDKQDIPKAIALIKEFLSRVNTESGKAENHFQLMNLNKDLRFRPGEYVDLKLTEEARQLVFKGYLKKNPTDNNPDILAYLFDHAVLLVRVKNVNKREEFKVYRKPIPLELLVIAQMDEIVPKLGLTKRPSSSLMGARTNTMTTTRTESTKQQGYPITFRHLGKGGYELTLYCTSQIQQQKFMENIEQQQRSLRERSNIFTKTKLNEAFFPTASSRVNCCVPIGEFMSSAVGLERAVC